MANAQGVNKQTRIGRQTAKGTMAVAALATAKVMRRESSTFAVKKDTFTTESEITSTMQITSNRHGAKQVDGKLTGLLSPGTYSDPLSALLRRDFAAVTAITGASITIAGTGPYTITRAAGSFLTDGIKVGMVIRPTAGAFNAANLNRNLFVIALTATVATVIPVDGSTLVAEGPIAAATVSIPGKSTFIPSAGHTNIYYTVEEWMSDVPSSERNLDVKFSQANLSMPGSGNAKIDFSALGLDQTSGVAQYFTAALPETSTAPCVAASGVLMVNSVQQAVITDMSVAIDGSAAAADAVVGSVLRPDVFSGKVKVSGSFTAYFSDPTLHAAFLNETQMQILSVLAADGSPNGDFISFAMYAVKINSSDPDDAETGMKRTYQFQATYNAAGGAGQATEKTTLFVQDSQA